MEETKRKKQREQRKEDRMRGENQTSEEGSSACLCYLQKHVWKLGEQYAAGPQSHSYAQSQEFRKAGFVWSFNFLQ